MPIRATFVALLLGAPVLASAQLYECFSNKEQTEAFLGKSFSLHYDSARWKVPVQEDFNSAPGEENKLQMTTASPGTFSDSGTWEVTQDGLLLRKFRKIGEFRSRVCVKGEDFYLGSTKMNFKKN